MSTLSIEQMIEQFQCPGCVCGCGISTCDAYNLPEESRRCEGHVLGSMIGGPAGLIALGLPKGFCKPAPEYDARGQVQRLCNWFNIRLWPEGQDPGWDKFNVAVWAMVKDGFLFVRTFTPRVDRSWIDVIENGTLDMVPTALDAAMFYDEMD